MENLIISKSICPSVSYDIRNHQLQPRGCVTITGSGGPGSPQLPGTPVLQLGEDGLGGPSWDGKAQNPCWIWARPVLPAVCCLLAPLGVLQLPPQPCQAPNCPHPLPPGLRSWRALPVPPQALGTPWDRGCWLLPAFLEHGRSCLGIAQAELCAKCWSPVQPCALML